VAEGRGLVISAASRPRLAAKARLRFDRKTERTMILFPEKGLELSASAADVVRLCTGEHTVAAIVEQLQGKYAAGDAASMEREILDFLNAMADRCLIEEAP
jgi:coenzyme PQQ biosynthesis protein PqqD